MNRLGTLPLRLLYILWGIPFFWQIQKIETEAGQIAVLITKTDYICAAKTCFHLIIRFALYF
jgi:hypothetical protein